MAGMDILKQTGQSLSSGISKAVIEIVDERAYGKEIMITSVKAQKAAIDAGLSTKELKKTLENIVKAANKEAADRNSMLPSNTAPKKRFEVKFNPSQLSFQAYGGRKVAKTDLAKSNADNQGALKLEYQEMTPRIQMNVQLVFDDYERTQAFMLEEAAMVRTGTVAAVSAYKKKTYSVRPEVEGFIGALRNNYTRKIRFYWGNMVYTGVLTHISAEYTMFSTDGNPIRANVHLGMLCADETLSDGYMGQWQKSYQKVFESDDTTNLGSNVQHVGNLLNINL